MFYDIHNSSIFVGVRVYDKFTVMHGMEHTTFTNIPLCSMHKPFVTARMYLPTGNICQLGCITLGRNRYLWGSGTVYEEGVECSKTGSHFLWSKLQFEALWVFRQGRTMFTNSPRKEKVTGNWRKIRNEELHDLHTSLNKYYKGDQIKNDEMGEACGTYGGEARCVQNFGEEL
jgi:hypothetical protein